MFLSFRHLLLRLPLVPLRLSTPSQRVYRLSIKGFLQSDYSSSRFQYSLKQFRLSSIRNSRLPRPWKSMGHWNPLTVRSRVKVLPKGVYHSLTTLTLFSTRSVPVISVSFSIPVHSLFFVGSIL